MESTTEQIAEQHVARGAALLDEHCLNWHEHIDQAQLRMESTYHCLLGQLFGGYEGGLRELFPEADSGTARHTCGIEHGFDTVEHDYVGLEELWAEQIAKRS